MRVLVVVAVVMTALPGWPTYERLCLPCHGAKGDGRGPAAPFTWEQPRAFTAGVYEWRTTPTGQPPTDDDLRTAIRFGAPGTSMPGFADVLSDTEIDRLIEVLKAFAPTAFARAGTPVALGSPPPRDAKRGAQLWMQQGCDKCHGTSGRGDAPGIIARPYDLTTLPVRRPRATDDLDTRRKAIATSIATGIAGTLMPGFAGTVTDPELWALADHVLALNANARPPALAALAPARIADDRARPLATGSWPGSDPDEGAVFGTPIAPQGPPPAQLAPAQASLSAQQCARCHAKQAREWQTSLHAHASTIGLPARELDHATEGATCNRCHTPLAEQQPGDVFDPALRAEGVTCAGCHVRDWIRRGPPRRASSLPSQAGYPVVELGIYERADFCMPCHQLPPRTAVNGKPLLNTYKEWLEGPHMRRGMQCQHCHMPDREHRWPGIHDRATVRQGIKLDARAHRSADRVTVAATLTNVGAGHFLPTTATPALYLRVELVDARGAAIAGATSTLRIGRDVYFDKQWIERSDTRIPPGEHVTMARAWTGGRTPEAVFARVTIEVHPDAFYEDMYERRLRAQLPVATRVQYEAALARARSSRFVAERLDVSVSRR